MVDLSPKSTWGGVLYFFLSRSSIFDPCYRSFGPDFSINVQNIFALTADTSAPAHSHTTQKISGLFLQTHNIDFGLDVILNYYCKRKEALWLVKTMMSFSIMPFHGLLLWPLSYYETRTKNIDSKLLQCSLITLRNLDKYFFIYWYFQLIMSIFCLFLSFNELFTY